MHIIFGLDELSLSIHFMKKKNKNPNVGIKNNYLELYNKKLDPGLNMVINSLIEGKDYIFEDEKY